ncbi:MAG TPA: aminotransferase class I/II-fold pyridoxal phosphate-dependent enzyme [Acidimicrobiia bacterium]|nr:aminotransferase class I/II-fold pyridoxal phosphate-dependent enzyme [Acidimicrobiia bacterium]
MTPPLASRTAAITPFRVVDVMEAAWAAERAGRSIVHLEVGEPDFPTPAPVVEAATKAIADGRVRYTSSLGIPELREAISGYYAERFGIDVPARRVVVTAGASGALLLALAATVDRDDAVLLADPGYPCNRNLIRLCEGVPVGLPVGADTDYQLTAGLVADRWSERTRGVLLASPSNPTGTLVAPKELAAIATEVDQRGGVCFVDEIYGELVYDQEPATVLASPGLLEAGTPFVINSFSKTFGMTGWRLGWMVCPDWALSAVEALAQNAFISPPAPAQHGGVAAFTPDVWAVVEERRKAFAARRDVLVEGLRVAGFGVPVMPQGAFYVYARSDGLDGDSMRLARRLLDEAGVAVVPGCDFGDHEPEAHLRFSYTTALDQIDEGVRRLTAWRAASA